MGTKERRGSRLTIDPGSKDGSTEEKYRYLRRDQVSELHNVTRGPRERGSE